MLPKTKPPPYFHRPIFRNRRSCEFWPQGDDEQSRESGRRKQYVCAVARCCQRGAGSGAGGCSSSHAGAQPSNSRATIDSDRCAFTVDHSPRRWTKPVESTFLFSAVEDRIGWAHLEARYNYENLKTGSLWTGYNFVAGRALVFQATRMFGVVLGKTTGIAPGYELSFTYKRLELFSEGEYVCNTKDKHGSFFYSWNELKYSLVNWLHFGLVDQVSKVHRTGFEAQRDVLLGSST